MQNSIKQILVELEQFGVDNDAHHTERSQRMLNITADTGAFLVTLLKAVNAQNILEIGTSNGYSTIWLADAAQSVGGHVTTVELSEFKYQLAIDNFRRAGLQEQITAICGDALMTLRQSESAGFDYIFLDSERFLYVEWWPEIKRVLRPGGVLVIDNAISHANEMQAFKGLLEDDADFTLCTVPVGNGELFATYQP